MQKRGREGIFYSPLYFKSLVFVKLSALVPSLSFFSYNCFTGAVCLWIILEMNISCGNITEHNFRIIFSLLLSKRAHKNDYTYTVFPISNIFIIDFFSIISNTSFFYWPHTQKNRLFSFIIEVDSTRIITWETLETSVFFFNRKLLVLCNLFEFFSPHLWQYFLFLLKFLQLDKYLQLFVPDSFASIIWAIFTTAKRRKKVYQTVWSSFFF